MNEDRHGDPLETRLAGLRLASPSDDFVGRGQALIRTARPAPGGWRAWLLPALSLALVLSVSANVFQLARTQKLESLRTEQLAQCETPAAVYFPADTQPGLEIAGYPAVPQTIGKC